MRPFSLHLDFRKWDPSPSPLILKFECVYVVCSTRRYEKEKKKKETKGTKETTTDSQLQKLETYCIPPHCLDHYYQERRYILLTTQNRLVYSQPSRHSQRQAESKV